MRTAALLAAGLLLAGCAGSSPSAQPTRTPEATRPAPAQVTKVLTVVEENHGPAAALEQMPRLAALADTYGHTTGYRALTHPSLPNYLALAGGSMFDVTDDGDPSDHPIDAPTVFDLALAEGKGAATYADGMSDPCQTATEGSYVPRHNPWVYFTPGRQACEQHDLPLGTTDEGALHDAIAAGELPEVGLLVPDLCHDAHDCSLRKADEWLGPWLDALMAGPDYRAGRLAIVVTFDEDENKETKDGSDVLTVVIAPQLQGKVVAEPLDHYSWNRWMTDLVGAEPLAPDVRSLGEAFGL